MLVSVACGARSYFALSPSEITVRLFFRMLSVLFLSLCSLTLANAKDTAESLALASPDGHLGLRFHIGERGRPEFDVTFRDIQIVVGSLGLEFVGSGELREHLQVTSVRRATQDQTYNIPVGKASTARDHHK